MHTNRLQYFAKNSNLHGLKYVANEKSCWIIRLFWAIMFLVNFTMMLRVFYTSYVSFQERAVSFVTETTYLEWNTTFPAITVCPIAGAELDWDESDNNLKEETEEQKLFISDLIYFTGSCYSCNSDCKICRTMNFTQQVHKYRKKCHDILKSCKWNGDVFNCCEKLRPLETEYGMCYSFNSIHTGTSQLYHMNKETGTGMLWMQAKEDVRIYFHAPEDVPFINSDPDQRREIMLGESLNISINVIEINNDETVKNVPIWKRGCRFPWENEDLFVHEFYSYSTCVVQCHADNHIKLCNCTHHLMPYYNKIKYCDINGLKCLTDNFDTVNRLHAKSFDSPGIVCDCLPSCVEPEYNVVVDTKGLKPPLSEILINVQSLPTSRFKRIVLRSTLDLVVSIGGAAGLFLGASLLSLIELLYLMLSVCSNTKQ